MDGTLDLEALVTPLRDDVLSGAVDIARVATDVVRRASRRIAAETPAELRTGLAQVGTAILDAQPAMAPLLTLVGTVLDAAGGTPDVEAGRDAACRVAEDFRSDLGRRTTQVANQTKALLPKEGRILTLSSSSTVREALLANPHREAVSVVVLESRPMQEGQHLAAALAHADVPVTLAVDAAAAALVPECTMVLLGADSIGDAGVVNKLGSMAAATAAGRAGVPVLVLADETKILPTGFPQHLGDPRPAREVWRPPAGVRIWNRYFETVPLEAVTWVVTESGAMTPAQVTEYRRTIQVPEELRAWAAGRS